MIDPNITRLLAFARILISEEVSMSVEELLCFLTVAAKPGLSVGELVQATGLPQSSVSRHLKRLSARSHSAQGRVGPLAWDIEISRGDQLVEQSVHAENSRQKALHVTSHGENLLERFRQATSKVY